MAISYALPPWLQGRAAPNPSEAFISSIGHGVSIGQQQSRQAQESALQAQRAAQEYAMQAERIAAAERKQAQDDEREQVMLQFKQQQLQEQSMIDQQKLQVQKAYHEQQGMLRRDALKEVAAKTQLAAQAAARKLAAQQQYASAMDNISQLEQSGQVTPKQAEMARRQTLMKFGPALGAPLGSLSQLSQTSMEPTTRQVTLPNGQRVNMIQVSPERWQLVPEGTAKEPQTVVTLPTGPLMGGGQIRGSLKDPAVKAEWDKMQNAEKEKAAAKAAAAAEPGLASKLMNYRMGGGAVDAFRKMAGVKPPSAATNAAPTGDVFNVDDQGDWAHELQSDEEAEPEAPKAQPKSEAPAPHFKWNKEKGVLEAVDLGPVTEDEYLAAEAENEDEADTEEDPESALA